MDSRAPLFDLSHTLERLVAETAHELRLADEFAASARDADRWGLRAEADDAAVAARRCRINALLLEARLTILRMRLDGRRP